MEGTATQAPAMGIFFVVWLVMMIGMVGSWIIFIVAIWRAMKAHQSIAQSLQRIAEK